MKSIVVVSQEKEIFENIEESVDRVKEAEEEERKAAIDVNKAKKNYEYAKKTDSPRDIEVTLKKLNKKITKHKISEKKLRKAQERAKKYQKKAQKIKFDVESSKNYSKIGDRISEKVENWTSNLLNKINIEIQGETGQSLKELIGQFATDERSKAIVNTLDTKSIRPYESRQTENPSTYEHETHPKLYPPFSSYVGNEPFIFISYAHEDKELVYPDIKKIHDDGFNIWYDEGIPLSSSWNDEVALSLKNSNCVLVFISNQSIKSVNVKNEINYALKYNKKFIPVYLEDIVLPAGLELQLVSIQGIHKNKLSEEQYHTKIREDLQKILS